MSFPHLDSEPALVPTALATSLSVRPIAILARASLPPRVSSDGSFCRLEMPVENSNVRDLLINPCPCGFWGDRERQCTCTPHQVRRYLGRLSGPLLDRIDICVEVPRLTFAELSGAGSGECSVKIRERVEKARQLQRQRFTGHLPKTAAGRQIYCNAQMGSRELRAFCRLTKDASSLLREAYARLGLSARSHDKVLKVARTVADLEGSEEIGAQHVAEALHYRGVEACLGLF